MKAWPNVHHLTVDFGQCQHIKEIEEYVEKALTPRDHSSIIVIGWSLGSMVALQKAIPCASRIQGMFLIGSTAQFVKSKENPYGCDPRQIVWLKRKIKKNPIKGLADFDQQMFSQSEVEAGEWRRWCETARLAIPSVSSLLIGLDYLQQFQIDPKSLSAMQFPIFLLSGAEDNICPPSGAKWLTDHLSRAKLTIWEETGHLPFWTQPQRFLTWMKEGLADVYDENKNSKAV
jgi:pimeloyl-[acyl-carrier protein] methyl ester esterase